MATTSPVFAGRMDDFLVLGEVPPGNDQAAMVRGDLPREIAWGWDEDLEFARRQNEQGIWWALRGWDCKGSFQSLIMGHLQ